MLIEFNLESLLKKAFFLLLLSLISMYFGFYNQYPVVTDDSGFYISYGFEGLINLPPFRPFMYCFLVRHLSLSQSLWFVALGQSIIISWLIYELIKLTGLLHSKKITLIIIIGLSFLSCYSFYVSQIMADIFSSISFLAILIILLSKDLSWLKISMMSVLFLIACLTHLSNSYVIFLTVSIFIIIYFLFKRLKDFIPKSRVVFIAALSFISLFSLPTANYLIYGQFRNPLYTHLFTMGRLVENGILKEFLNDKCAEEKYKLCDYTNSINTNITQFIFTKDGVVCKTDGFLDTDGEYKKIIRATLTEKKYLLLHAYKSAFLMMKLLSSYEIGQEMSSMTDESYASSAIWKSLNNEFTEYKLSKQNSGLLNFELTNFKNGFFLFFSILIIVIYHYFFPLEKLSDFQLVITIFFILFILVNAFICGSASGSFARYNTKIIWLINLLSYLHIAFLISNRQFRPKISNS